MEKDEDGECFPSSSGPRTDITNELKTLKQPGTCASTYRGPLPFDGHWNALAKEERGVGGRKIWILKQDALLETLLPQLLEGLPV